jgi:TolB-like protein/Flp pilus assembly protein TadD
MQVHPREAGNRPFDLGQSTKIRTYLDALLTSPNLRLPARRERMFRYLVDRTLAGEADRINEYAIGVDVFDRPPDFDPKVDAVVRAEVSRLRQNLKDYYSGPGQMDRTVIDLPSRSYAPAISFREPVPLPAPPAETPLKPAPRWPYFLALGAVLLIGIGIAQFIRSKANRFAPSIQSLVVLPFQDLSSNHQSEYLADGLTDEVTNDLANLQDLRVIARTTAFEYKGKGVDVRQIGRQLNVDAALEGSLVREGNRVRIRAQLNRTSDGTHLWSHAYDIDAHDLIGVQEQIAQSIADDMNLGRGRGAVEARTHRFTADPEAHDLYLRGMEALNAGDVDSLRRAAAFFQSAIDKDRNFAMAWLGLARTHDLMQSAVVPGITYELIGTEARRALDLDPNLAEAHETLAIIAWERDYDWPTAEREFRLAIADNGSASARSHAVYGYHLADRGRFAESHQHLRTAQELSPLEVIPLVNEGWVYFFEHLYPQAERAYKRVLELHPDNAPALEGLAYLKTRLGDCRAGGEYADKLNSVSPNAFRSQSVQWNLLVCRGEVAKARSLLDAAAPKMAPFYAGASYSVLGEKELALKYLDRSVAEHDNLATTMGVSPYLDNLRSDPRFIAIERRAGLDPHAP